MIPLYSDDLVQKYLITPALSKQVNRLCILATHASPSMVSWLLKTYEENKIFDISVELIIGDTVDHGIDSNTHEAFRELHGNRYSSKWGNFSCSYLYTPPGFNESWYIWLDNERSLQAFSTSNDFTQSSMLRKNNTIIKEHTASYAYKIYEKIVDRSIFCNHAEVEDYVIIHAPNISLKTNSFIDSEQHVTLSFITRTGETGTKSGLNWGQRNNRNRNEAYIPLPRPIAKSGFFPLNKQHFLVVTDDHHMLQLRVEQQNDKAITTPASNALLGEYFRNRLGLANGAYVSIKDLNNYGRTDVTFYKIDDEQYFMDFSVHSS